MTRPAGVFTYANDGRREPFDPQRVTENMAGCCLCDAPVAVVGIFLPTTDVMRKAVLRLRRHPVRARSTTALAYGLCLACADLDGTSEQVEADILAAAERVVMQ